LDHQLSRSDGALNSLAAEFNFTDSPPPADNGEILAWLFPVFFIFVIASIALALLATRSRFAPRTWRRPRKTSYGSV
jgi:cytochrome c-type biogenesis protein CcmH/NrfF